MSRSLAAFVSGRTGPAPADDAILPFKVSIPQGVPARWRRQEPRLNAYPQYRTRIDGAELHFLHVRSPEREAMPLLLLHGFPGSVAGFHQLIGPLVDPAAHGGRAADAFHLVIPSLPGTGFSGPIEEGSWGLRRVANALARLMTRAGYRSFGVHGGDLGGLCARALGLLEPARVLGAHLVLDGALRDLPGRASLERDALLCNTLVDCLSGSAASAARVYDACVREAALDADEFSVVPTALAVAQGSWCARAAERSNNVVYRSELENGQALAAPRPERLASDLRTFFRRLR